MSQYEKHVFEAIYGRKNVRVYLKDKKVEHEKIIKLLKAGMASPIRCKDIILMVLF